MSELEALFRDPTYLAALFPGPLMGERQESHELMRGLGAAIQKQFARWELTAAESEIGLLLLKGLSHKQIAGLRQTSERTVREQARSLYRKAGLSGRASLSAFFLEYLLLPNGTGLERPRDATP